MVSREWAIKVVEQHLALRTPGTEGLHGLVVVGTEEHRLGWFVYTQSEGFARSRAFRGSVIGAGYFLVDGLDGSLHHMHASADPVDGNWIEDYLEEVRGVPRPDPLRQRVAQLVQRGERLAAIRAARSAVPAMDPTTAKRYVDAVAAGAPIPDDVEARLPKPSPPLFAVRRAVTGPNAEPDG
ncbi:YrhB domain-containing protein [Catenulispora subtropica]|uniref:Immunity protein 35 domain-containing protein n=1 Tax=Catenulispora subtropica TaxID=450798 RepID=A0ABN2SWR1_9ACTN